ncbi:RICIN domain-containing protein [Streptomyces scabiei]|uniref:Flavastacin n=1 Tax=Streptomyces scabiei TaxID=1930 RepID=A0A100JJM9_STRSC|nr:RICIN domain-containing protein [Streptomyces scabiei]GAQ60779.1 flavastacin precursor [Streptomyces scabiei]
MNAYKFLDRPGEFYFNKTSHTLYSYKSGSEETTAKVFAPNNVSTILKIAGTSRTDHARTITFSGLTVEHSDWNLVKVGDSVFRQVQQGNVTATVYAKKNFHAYTYRNVDLQPTMIQAESADGINLQRNTVQHTGADAITVANDVTDSQVTGNYVNDTAGSAITVGHPQHVYIGDYAQEDLAAGPHTIGIVCTGKKNASSSNTVCALDAFAHIAFPAKNGFYKMLNKSSGKAVDISGGSNADGANIIHWTDSGAQNQRWRYIPVGGGSYEIVSQDTGKLLDVGNGSTADGAAVVQWSDNNGANQHWTLVATGNGYYKIKNVKSDKVLALPASGSQLVQTTDTSADGQLWKIVNVD